MSYATTVSCYAALSGAVLRRQRNSTKTQQTSYSKAWTIVRRIKDGSEYVTIAAKAR